MGIGRHKLCRIVALIVDIQQVLSGRGPEVFDDEVHLTLEGHALMADVVYRALTEAGGLPQAPVDTGRRS